MKNLPKYIWNKFRESAEAQIGPTGVVNLIDVGAAGGLPSPWDTNVRKIRNLLKFEPRNEAVEAAHVVAMDTALWRTDCEKDFYIYGGFNGTGSSLFTQNYQYVEDNFQELRRRGPKILADTWFERSKLVATEKIQCRSLDGVLDELNQPFDYHFLKIDAQGAEYEILEGAQRFLKRSCLGLLLELFTIPLYEEIKLLPEVTEYLAGLGFELSVKFPAQATFDAAHDCLFLKKGADGEVAMAIRKIYGLE